MNDGNELGQLLGDTVKVSPGAELGVILDAVLSHSLQALVGNELGKLLGNELRPPLDVVLSNELRFCINTVGAVLGVGDERKLMEVTTAEPARMSLISLTFAMLIANSWYELSPNISTSIGGSSNIPSPVSMVQ